MPRIRRLSADDRSIIRGLFDRAADYVVMETGHPPEATASARFLDDCPPGGDVATSLKLGLFAPDGQLAAIADLAFGYPDPTDAYVGLLLIEPGSRGGGLGRIMLDHLVDAARMRGAERILAAVLDENSGGRAFWERAGFQLDKTIPRFETGAKIHVLHRLWRRL